VVTLFPADQACTLPLTPYTVIGNGNLQRRINRLGSGVGKKSIIQIPGGKTRKLFRQFENTGVAQLKGCCVIKAGRLALNRGYDLRMAMPGISAP